MGPLSVPAFVCAPGLANPDLFFPITAGGRRDDGGKYAAARKACAECPVRDRCQDFGDITERGLGIYSMDGFLAGETPEERVARRTVQQIPTRTERWCCTSCGQRLRQQGVPKKDAPGTVCYGADGKCKSCHVKALAHINTDVNWRGTCRDCGRTLRKKSVPARMAPGTICGFSNTECGACHWRAKREAVAA